MFLQLWLLGHKRASAVSSSYRKWMGVGRVVAYGTVVSFALGALSFRSALADAKTESLKVGRDLADLQDVIGEATAIRINGQPIFVGTASTMAPVKDVLDRFEAHCARDPALQLTKWGDVGKTDTKPIKGMQGLNSIGVLRQEDPKKHDGIVVCFTRDDNEHSRFMDAARAFVSSGNLKDIGNLRFVHANETKSGATAIQTVWTEGDFDTHKIMDHGPTDAVGSDSSLLPRPGHSVRRFTAEAVGAPYTARIYDSTEAGDAILKAFDTEMISRNWLAIDSPLRDQDAEIGRWYAHDGLQAMISIRKNDDGTSQVMIGEMGQAHGALPVVKKVEE